MWLFFSDGVLMPALIPKSVLAAAKTPDIVECVERGWDLQVRGRVAAHLEAFIEKYMDPSKCSAVISSQDKDYTQRFYTTRQAYGEGLLKMSLAIDYTKFKDTAKEPKYHDLLLKVWSASTSLARPGGFYGPRAASNPRGYSKSRRARRYEDDTLPLGASFYPAPRTSRSIHDLTDDELEDMWNRS